MPQTISLLPNMETEGPGNKFQDHQYQEPYRLTAPLTPIALLVFFGIEALMPYLEFRSSMNHSRLR